MFCPQCGAEYRSGFDRCADCEVALVAEPPPEQDHQAEDPWVVVFATSETDVLPVIKSLLRSAEIPLETDGEAMLNLFPSDLLGPVLSRPRGEVRFKVPQSREAEARALLAERSELPEGALIEAEPGEAESED